MHDDRLLVEGRLTRAMNQFVRPARYAGRVPLGMSVWHVEDRRGEPLPVGEALKAWSNGSFEPFTVGTSWGPPWSTSWFRLEGTVPSAWAGRRVEAVIDPGFGNDGPGFVAEGMVYDAEGVPIKGINPLNRHVPVAAPAAGGERVGLLLEAAANPAVLRDWRPNPLGDVLTAGPEPLYRFDTAELAVSATACCGSRSTRTGCWPPSATWPPAGRCWRRGRAATCCSCTPTTPPSGTPGTSTATTAAGTPT